MRELRQVQLLLERIRATPTCCGTKLIGIDGRGGSGKSTVASQLCEMDPSLAVVPLDWFPCLAGEFPFHPMGTQTRVSLCRLTEQVLIPLREGRAARCEERSWWDASGRVFKEHRIPPGRTVIVEGCYSLHSDVRAMYDLKVWVACDADLALNRAVRRDGEPARASWETVYRLNEDAYVQKQRPDLAADIVIYSDELVQ